MIARRPALAFRRRHACVAAVGLAMLVAALPMRSAQATGQRWRGIRGHADRSGEGDTRHPGDGRNALGRADA